VPTSTSSGFNRVFLWRASSFRLSKQPSCVYPVAVILADGSPTGCFVCDAQATRNNDEAMPSAIRRNVFTVTSSDRSCDYRLMAMMDLKGQGLGRVVGLGACQTFPFKNSFPRLSCGASSQLPDYFREGTCSELMKVVRLSEKHKECVKKREENLRNG